MGLTYKKENIKNLILKGYSNVDYVKNLHNRRSTAGNIYLLGQNKLIPWNSTL